MRVLNHFDLVLGGNVSSDILNGSVSFVMTRLTGLQN